MQRTGRVRTKKRKDRKREGKKSIKQRKGVFLFLTAHLKKVKVIK
jgi:hypothetical protein